METFQFLFNTLMTRSWIFSIVIFITIATCSIGMLKCIRLGEDIETDEEMGFGGYLDRPKSLTSIADEYFP